MKAKSRAIFLGVGVACICSAALPQNTLPLFSDEEKATIASLSLDALPPLPPDPSNRYATDSAAQALGATLFFERRWSADGTVSCASCHDPAKQFQDGLPRGKGVGVTDRRTMPIAGAAYSPWQFWDGRADSLWGQALDPLEDHREHGGNRLAFARFVSKKFGARYVRIFGELPDFSGLPENAGPRGDEVEKAAWAAMSEEGRDTVNRVFVNIGKAIAAFETSLLPGETRFDRFARALSEGAEPKGDAAFTAPEVEGLKLFIGKAECVTCHNGPRLTDDRFHNTGVPQAGGLPEDHGRVQGLEKLLADPFNCLGRYSDAGPGDCTTTRAAIEESATERAFKTPSLRGAASRPPYMHSGQIATLADVLDHYSQAPEAPAGETEIRPLDLTLDERAALIAFLKTLDAE